MPVHGAVEHHGEVQALLAFSLLVSNIADAYRLRSEWRAIREISLYLPFALAFVPVGVWFLGFGDPDFIRLLMGVMAYAYLLVESRLGSFKELGAGLQKIVGATDGRDPRFSYTERRPSSVRYFPHR